MSESRNITADILPDGEIRYFDSGVPIAEEDVPPEVVKYVQAIAEANGEGQ